MAQKKKVSVNSVASNKAKEVKKTAAARTKSTATKKTAVKSATKAKATTSTKQATASKATQTKKTATTAAKAAPKVSARKAPVKATAKTAKPATAKKAPAAKAAQKAPAKAASNTRAKIAAAAKKVAAQKTARAPVKKSAANSKMKAVAAAAPTTAKRSSEPVAAAPAGSGESTKKPAGARHGFKLHEYVVYPAHGVGQIVAIEEQEIAGMSLELFVITFEKDKMTLRVPTSKVDAMRKLSEGNIVEKAMTTLKGRARIKRTMWSRRAQEYENKINSGDLIAIAEVVRDLYRSENQPEQSYSERQLYEAALDRMARELAAVDKIDERQATQRIVDVLSKSAKGRRLAEEEKAASDAEKDGDAEAA